MHVLPKWTQGNCPTAHTLQLPTSCSLGCYQNGCRNKLLLNTFDRALTKISELNANEEFSKREIDELKEILQGLRESCNLSSSNLLPRICILQARPQLQSTTTTMSQTIAQNEMRGSYATEDNQFTQQNLCNANVYNKEILISTNLMTSEVFPFNRQNNYKNKNN